MLKGIYEFLKFNKYKAIVSLITPPAFGTIIFLIRVINPSEYIGISVPPVPKYELSIWVAYLLSYLTLVVLVYPFACSVVITSQFYREGDLLGMLKDKSTIIPIVGGFLIFNPFSVLFLLFLAHPILNQDFVQPPSLPNKGVEIIELSNESPFSDIGLKVQDVITEIKVSELEKVKVDEKRYVGKEINVKVFIIENSTIFYKALKNMVPGDWVQIKVYTPSKITTKYFTVRENITDWGITVKDIELR